MPTTTIQHNSIKNLASGFRAEKSLPILAGIVALLGFAFLWIAAETMQGVTQGFDEHILLSLRNPLNHALGIGPSWLMSVMRDVSALGGVAVLTLMIASISGALLLRGRHRMTLFLWASIAGGTVGMLVLKSFFQRPRPSIVPHLVDITQTSFPSGHSMVSAIVYLTLAALLARATSRPILRIYYLAVGICLTLLIGFSRVYLGVHYPTDVLAGWCAGAGWASVCYLITTWLQRRGKVEPESAESSEPL